MKRIVVTGALGQIGSDLVFQLRQLYGEDAVLATDIRNNQSEVVLSGPFHLLDVTDGQAFFNLVRTHQADTIIHLAALLSAKAEDNPLQAWQLNMGGLLNALEVARERSCQFFTPSSIASFGHSTPKEATPQNTMQRPATMYGVSKVAGELLCDYYFHKFGLDTRGLRFPGLVSHTSPPGGGTTDYAVDMYLKAARGESYTSYISEGTFLDMMYMPDAIQAVIQLMETDAAKLIHRNAFNVSAMSVDPEMIAVSIRRHVPDFILSYESDPIRQKIAEEWPNAIDTSAARTEWNFQTKFNLDQMTDDMLSHLA
ncbi:NAD-dependent epimerase/dehydratase family protein [Paenibacillus sp. Marseille-Q4541]|uniref:NAD-dependent epimerase/dehydratase family protein n=1 Tax=Paenibacillus sp. Marseille-Q4541 TaxID=2831522 RepID=UPI001BAA37B9|nr:NAD-dependent epimerase/dehydratase family protein [Paenibacillus sp. Marseille-Q4541]